MRQRVAIIVTLLYSCVLTPTIFPAAFIVRIDLFYLPYSEHHTHSGSGGGEVTKIIPLTGLYSNTSVCFKPLIFGLLFNMSYFSCHCCLKILCYVSA